MDGNRVQHAGTTPKLFSGTEVCKLPTPATPMEPSMEVRRFLFAAAAAAAVPLAACGPSGNAYQPPPPPEVTVAPPQQREITEYLDTTGTLRGLETVQIRARVRGFVEEIDFTPGDRVEAGQVLLKIDPAQYEADVRRAEADLDKQKAQLGLAEATLQKYETLLKKSAVSEQETRERRAERDVAKAQVGVAEAVLENARIDLGYTQVKAPIAGNVGVNRVDEGALVVAEGEPTLLTTIVNDREVYAYFNVSEQQMLELLRRAGNPEVKKPQERAKVFLGLMDETGYPHQGRFDSWEPQLNPETGTLLVRAVFQNPDGLLVPGGFVRLRIPLAKREALTVPEVAVARDQVGPYVFVVNAEDKVERRNLEVAPASDGLVPVEKGLAPGERVIVNGLLRARPGAEVKPVAASPG